MSQSASNVVPEQTPHFDVVVIGAGVTGLHQLQLLRTLGLSVRVLEAGSGVGGTWYWNRYPGARLDSESYSYQYAFSEELLAEWNWTELFAGQPELERYLNRVADKYGLRSDIQFDTRVTQMDFDEAHHRWTIRTDRGDVIQSHLVIAATGILSTPHFPEIPGIDAYTGQSYHTGLWPADHVDFTGKRVVVIGTGASGVQVISEIAKTAEHLAVFQRTANWAVPLRNKPLSAEEMAQIRNDYPDTFTRLRKTVSGFLHEWDPVPTTAYTPKGLNDRYERAWNGAGFAKWIGLPNDVAKDPEANKSYCQFLAAKVRERVTDPATADKLIPDDHLFGTRRVPCETGYYETYNRDNVYLELLADNPIHCFTPTGLRTASGDIEADIIVLATGFDAFTGALNKIDISGVGGVSLREKWVNGPTTYLGIQVAGFPNLFIMGGPHGKGGHGNSPRCSEQVVEWMTEFVGYIAEHRIDQVEADPEAERVWTEHVYAVAAQSLMATAKSYFYGDNVEGKAHAYVAYLGSLPEFVDRIRNIAKDGYTGFLLS